MKLEAQLALLNAFDNKSRRRRGDGGPRNQDSSSRNFLDETGAIVEPAVPAFLGKVDTRSRRATRLDLANWLVSEGNPLTARVYANRVWRQFFGTGIVKTVDDVGSQGEWPKHPELLDWLASEFMHPQYDSSSTHDWDMMHLVRTIVMSDAYRRSSAPRPDTAEKDPDNRLLAAPKPVSSRCRRSSRH